VGANAYDINLIHNLSKKWVSFSRNDARGRRTRNAGRPIQGRLRSIRKAPKKRGGGRLEKSIVERAVRMQLNRLTTVGFWQRDSYQREVRRTRKSGRKGDAIQNPRTKDTTCSSAKCSAICRKGFKGVKRWGGNREQNGRATGPSALVRGRSQHVPCWASAKVRRNIIRSRPAQLRRRR